jgi:hypothetical protein
MSDTKEQTESTHPILAEEKRLGELKSKRMHDELSKAILNLGNQGYVEEQARERGAEADKGKIMDKSLENLKGKSLAELRPELTPSPERQEQLMKELFGPGKHRVETIRIDPKTGRPENRIIW